MIKRFTPILALTAACWLVFALNSLVWHGHLDQHGIIPRHLAGLAGIIWAPFLHASFQHLAANTVPLLVLGAIICARGKGEFAVVTVGGILLGGGLTWLFARNAIHIGASGLIFCYFGYVASLAWFNRTFGTLCLSVRMHPRIRGHDQRHPAHAGRHFVGRPPRRSGGRRCVGLVHVETEEGA